MPVIRKTASKPAVPVKKAAPSKAVAKKAASPSKAAPRRSHDDEDAPTSKRSGVATTGWDGAGEIKAGGGDFIRSLDFNGEAHSDGDLKYFVIKFLEDGPYANTAIHWIDRKGKRSFVCAGEDCPLCDIGDKPKAEYRFNVAVLTDGEPKLRSWNTGYKIFNKIKAKAEAPHTKPLTKKVYLATRTGRAWNEIEYGIEALAADDVESYEVYVPTKDEIAAMERYTIEDLEKEYSSREELEEIAAEQVEGE